MPSAGPQPPGRRAAGATLVTAILLAALLAACAGGDASGSGTTLDGRPPATATREPDAAGADSRWSPAATPVPSVRPSGPFPAGHVTLQPSAGDPVRIAVHVAADQATRRRGLMHREVVPSGTGMLFVWPQEHRGPFWMKDTLVPLSIAFADGSGEILRILDMEPCEAHPCPRYDPRVAYRFALEVPRGDFARYGVREGDLLLVPPDRGG